MAGTASEESGVGRSLEGISSGQRCQSSEALAEWRSSEQVENGTPSTSPPYWDTDDDEDCGPKPSDLYGKYTWKIDKFSQINKRELRSNAFEVGGYKWYILIYPQGCDVCNHLSLFLCVANHDKLLPGWSHFAQFTIAVVNKDPKKSKYSDTLHRFWKKEHDWGWKKFMELSKVIDGFIDTDTLIIKAQVQVIRERADRPFRCLDCQYRRELVRVYLTNVEQHCRKFVEDSRATLGKLIADKSKWSSFCLFWLGIDQNARRRMSREKTDSILKAVVKRFFIEKEVTSTLIMDSLYSGLKALEGQIKSKKVAKGKYLDAAEEIQIPIVRIEKDTFVLVDDVLLLLERAAMEPLPPKDEKGPQNRTKDGGSGEDFTKDSIERDERRLTELGRRTIEIFVLAHIYSSKIEIAFQEAVALKRQEELIREEEAAWLAECDHKAKRGALEKEKKSKKKQGKQKRNNRKGKEKGKDEKSGLAVADKTDQESPSDGRKDTLTEDTNEKPDMLEDVSDVSDSLDCVPEILRPDSEERDSTRSVNWDTDTSEVQPPMEPSGSGLTSVQNGERKSPSLMDDSSSTCSTDSLPSVVMNGPYKGTSLPNQKNQKSPSRGRNQRGRAASDVPVLASDGHRLLPSETLPDAGGQANDVSGTSCKVTESESEAAVVNSLQDRIKRLEQHVFKKEEEVVSLQRKLTVKDEVDMDRPKKETAAEVPHSPRSPPINPPLVIRSKPEVKKPSLDSPQPSEKVINSAETSITSKPNANKAASPKQTEKPATQQAPVSTEKPNTQKVVPVLTGKTTAQPAPAMSRPLSAPLIPGPRPASATPVVSMVQTAPLLSRSVSAAGRLGPDPSPATHSYIPQSYRNAMMGNHIPSSSASFTQPHSPNSIAVSSSSHSYSQPPPVMMSGNIFLPQGSERMDQNPPIRPSLSFGMLNPSLMNDFQNMDLYNHHHHHHHHPVQRSQDRFLPEFQASVSGRQPHGGVIADEFPHLDIINDLLDEEQGIGSYPGPAGFRSFGNGPPHLHRQFTFPGDMGMSSEVGPSTSSCGFERRGSLDEFQHGYSQFDMVPQGNLLPYANGHIDSGMVPNEWQMGGSDLSYLGGLRNNAENDGYPYHHIHEYPNLSCGVNGYTVFRPSNGH